MESWVDGTIPLDFHFILILPYLCEEGCNHREIVDQSKEADEDVGKVPWSQRIQVIEGFLPSHDPVENAYDWNDDEENHAE